jgi:phthiocerol/phenolphthiocerol synthesis type-I polyketide synthase C
LRRRWAAVGAALTERCRSGDRALLLLPQGLNFAAAFFGCLASGVIAVPAYPPRPRRPSPRLERIIADCGVSLVITDRATRTLLEAGLAHWPQLAALPMLVVDEIGDESADTFRYRDAAPGAPAFLQYTSGSTGDPKGVMVTDRNLVENVKMIASRRAQISPDETSVVSWQPLLHDMGLIANLFTGLFVGGAVTLLSPAAFLQRPLTWLEAISKYRGTHCGGPDFAFDLCVERITPAEVAALDLSSWKQAFCGAEPIRLKTLDRFAAHFAPAGFRRDAFYPCYGLAEATLLVSGGRAPGEPIAHAVDRAALAERRLVAVDSNTANEGAAKTFVGCGTQLLEQEILIVDPDTRRALGDDELGEIWTRGPSTTAGYWNRPEQTAAVFNATVIKDDGSTGESGYLRTGDLGFMRRGELFVAGRLKDLIILRSVNLYPQDLELTVCEAHAAVAPAGAAVVQFEVGDEERLLVVAEVTREARKGNLDEVLTAIRQAVTAEHEVRPDVVVLIAPLSLPRTTSGKVRRSECRDRYLAGDLPVLSSWEAQDDGSSPLATDPHVLEAHNESPHEWLTVEIGRRIGLPPHEVDTRAPFDRFGIDSAAAVEIAAALGRRLGRHLPATLVYEYPTIDSLVRYLTDEGAEDNSPTQRRRSDEPLAVVGMACRFPGGADSPEAFWQILRDGVNAVSDVPADRWNIDLWYDADPDAPGKMSTRCGAFLNGDVNAFDAAFFGITPREAASVDPQQRLLLETAWHAVENAGLTRERLQDSDTGVFIGISTIDHTYIQAVNSEPRLIDPYSGSGGVHSLAAGRLSYFLGLRGPCFAVDTACSSSLVALHSAGQSLRAGECRAALVGGVNLVLSPDTNVFFSKLRAMSPDGKCKSFDASADGYVRGEGCGVVVLKRLSDALADGDRIHAVVRGSAVNHGGRSNGLFAPNAPAQERVIRQALAAAGVAAEDVDYIEAHGTGTALGDPIELRALAAAVGRAHTPERPVRIGTAKTNIGHLEAAAGMAGLIKAILSLEHEQLAPLLHFKALNPHASLVDGRMSLVVEPTAWPRSERRRLAGVSSFGFGGTNAHVIVEEAPQTAPAALAPVPSHDDECSRERILVVSAPTADALAESCARLADYVADTTESLDDVCYAAALTRSSFARRAVVIASSRDELVRLLGEAGCGGDRAAGQAKRSKQCASRGCGTRGKLVRGESTKSLPARVVWLFSGQGSQYAGMGRELYEQFPIVRRTLDRCQEILRDELPLPLLDVMFNTPADGSPIDDTTYTQPALFALGYALAELWKSWGVEPTCMVGHSIGEYVAACRAGVFSLEDALRLTARRGRLMQQAPGDGLMAAVFLPEAELLEELASFAGDSRSEVSIATVSIAAVNSSRNTVVSGSREAVQSLLARLAARGVQAQPLVTSHAFHSSLMDPILADFRTEAERVTYSLPERPILSNLTGTLAGPEIATADYWTRHLRAPVRFADGLRAATAGGCDLLIELGPTPVLLGMSRDVLGDSLPALVPSLRPGTEARSTLLRGLAELYVRGANIAWPIVHDAATPRRNRVELPAYPFQHQQYHPPKTVADYERRLIAETLLDDGHPLLGSRLEGPPSLAQHRRRLAPNSPSLLADHRVFEQTVFPAAGFCELALAAGAEWFKRVVAVVDLKIERPLMLAAEAGVMVQTIVYRETSDTARFEVYRKPDAATADDAWALHASGRIDAAAAPTSPFASRDSSDAPSLESLRSAAGESVDIEELYRMFRDAGLDYGPTFRAVRRLDRGEGFAVGRLELAAETLADTSAYRLHPALLDGAFQMLAVCLAEDGGDDVYLPTGCERLEVLEPLDGCAWADVRLRPTDAANPNVLTADIRLWTDVGRPAAYVAGLVLTRVPRGDSAKLRLAELFYETTWEPRELPAGSAEPRKLLVVAEATDLNAAALCERLAAAGWSVRRAASPPLDADVEPDFAAWSALVDASGTNGSSVDEVAYFPPRPSAPEPNVAELESLQQRLCGDVLALARTLSARDHAPRLRLITAGANMTSDESTINVAHAPLWGLARSLAMELPSLRAARIDLPWATSANAVADVADLDALARIFQADTPEDQLAVRSGTTLAARLRRYAPDDAARNPPPVTAEETYRLKIGRYGILDSLYFEPMPRKAPAAGEVEIEVRASALNFRDVLHALGMLKEHAAQLGIASEADMPLGFECAGVVTALGAGVDGLRIGDEVLAGPAVGCLAGHVVVPSAFVVRKPKSLSFAEAAALPIAYLTAVYSFEERARLKSGESVLIHAAAGGVGQAAVQVAHMLGAEVFATAGRGKWDVLRRQGVKHVMNSRDTEFADTIATTTAGHGVDVVLNSLNGDYIPCSFRSTASNGRFVEIGKIGAWTSEQAAEFRSDVAYHHFDLGEVSSASPNLIAGMLRAIVERIDAGSLHGLPVETFPASEAALAFRHLSQAKHIGKVVLTLPTPAERTDAAAIRDDRTYLITGGLGALGLRTARRLADQGAKHVALAGRSEPRGDALRTIETLRARGVDVRTFTADVGRAADTDRLIKDIAASLPPLAGVVHAAGLLDDGLLIRQTWNRFRNVLAPKALGAWNLHLATESTPLDFFVCFSSVAATIGSPGQANYAAANAFLDALMQLRRARRLPGLSIAWGPWSGRGMAGGSARNAALERTMPKLSAAQAFAALESLMQRAPASVTVARVNWSAFCGGFPNDAVPPLCEHVREAAVMGASGERRSSQALELLARFPALNAEDRLAALSGFIQQRVEHVFGCDAGTQLDPQSPLQQQGLDSLMGVELKNQLEVELGASIPVTMFFEGVTIRGLAEALVEPVLQSALAATGGPTSNSAATAVAGTSEPVAPPTTEDAAQLLAKLEDLSDEEIERLLEAELRSEEAVS